MIKICNDIYLIKNRLGANSYILDNGDYFDIIDAGMFKETNELITEVEKNKFDFKKLRLIILTHCHCDHIGGTSALVKYADAKVAAFETDIPYILQKKVLEGPYNDMMVFEQKLMRQYNCVITGVDVVLHNNDVIDTIDQLVKVNGFMKK